MGEVGEVRGEARASTGVVWRFRWMLLLVVGASAGPAGLYWRPFLTLPTS